MATAFNVDGNPKGIGSACVDLTDFRPTALLPDDYDVMLIKTADCMENATDGTCYVIVCKRNQQVPLPAGWLDGYISAQTLGAGG